MSYIPGEVQGGNPVQSLIGSGITVQQASNASYVSANLQAGANITLTPSPTTTAITVSAPGAVGGISAVASANGSGITATTAAGIVSLTSALQAGPGISLNPSGTTTALTINNTSTLTSNNGSGINLIGTGPNYGIEAALQAGPGVSITNDPATKNKNITNTGVLSVNAGKGVNVSSSTGNITITNQNPNPITSIAGSGITVGAGQVLSTNLNPVGSGISITNGTGTAKNITNTGVVQINAGTGITVSSPTGTSTITNNGVRTLTVNAPLTTTGGPNPTISLGPLTGGLKVSYCEITTTSYGFPNAGGIGKVIINFPVGTSIRNDIVSAPIPDANGTWLIDFNCLLFTKVATTPTTEYVQVGWSQGNNLSPTIYNNPNQAYMYGVGAGFQFITTGQVLFPINAVASALGINFTTLLGLTFQSTAGFPTITQGTFNSRAYAVYYPNGLQ